MSLFDRKKRVHPNAKCFWCKKRIGKKREGYTICGYMTCWSCALDMLMSPRWRGYDGENYRDT